MIQIIHYWYSDMQNKKSFAFVFNSADLIAQWRAAADLLLRTCDYRKLGQDYNLSAKKQYVVDTWEKLKILAYKLLFVLIL